MSPNIWPPDDPTYEYHITQETKPGLFLHKQSVTIRNHKHILKGFYHTVLLLIKQFVFSDLG